MGVKNYSKKMLFKLPRPIINGFYSIYNNIKYPNMREEKHSFGNQNKGITFYIIRPRTDCIEGLMSLFLNVVKNLYYAEKQGYTPVVDFENYMTQYSGEILGTKNVWEFYFEQPTKYSLDEAYSSANVILSGLQALISTSNDIDQSFDARLMVNSKTLISKYIRFSPEVNKIVLEEIENWNMGKILGLYMRGTDYTKLRPADHPIQPSFEQAKRVVDDLLKKNNLEYVFLVTEDAEIYECASKYYGKKLLIVSFDSFISGYKGGDFLGRDEKSISQLADTPYQRGVNYLVKLIILSKCQSFVGGNTCGSWASCTFENNFKDQYIFELGRY